MSTGYLHPDYAASLAEFGNPRELPHCQGWILEREIPGFPDRDAMGCYPLFTCEHWSQLHRDLDEIGDELVSLALVSDPFGDYDEVYLHRCFDRVVQFKEHFVADLHCPIDKIVAKRKSNYAKQALRNLDVEICQDPKLFLKDWVNLYAVLIKRHGIQGINAFSRKSFCIQLGIPGLVMLRAIHQGATVGMQLWFLQEETAYHHLTAFSEAGYKLRASYAICWSAIEYFLGRVRWLDWGGGAGVKDDRTDGLSQFKHGWSTGTRKTYFCSRILNLRIYSEIVRAKDVPETNYFPAYRQGEFG
jgi:hypothetical protein